MKLITVLTVAVVISGCSSSPKSSKLVSDQYCHTSQTIEREDDTVSSKTVVKCTDDPVERYVPARLGIAKDCHPSHIPININGKLIYEKVYACQKYDGRYDVIESRRMR